MKQLTNNVYGVLLWGGFVNGYVIDHPDGLVVVDTGLGSGFVKQLTAGFHEKKWALANIQHILLTHFHLDHIGGLADLQQHTTATTYAHRADAPIIRGEQPPVYGNIDDMRGFDRFMRWLLDRQPSKTARVDVDLEDGTEILPGLQAVHFPGHSRGHTGFLLEADGVLLGGDVAMRMTGNMTMPFRAPSPDWAAVSQSIRRAADLKPNVLGLGHGQPLVGDATEKLNQLATRIGA